MSGYVKRVPLSGGKTTEFYVVGREDPEERIAREAVEDLLDSIRYEWKYRRRLRDLIRLHRFLELDVEPMRERVVEILRTEQLDDVDRALFRGLLDDLDELGYREER
jgi:hypothetical protein